MLLPLPLPLEVLLFVLLLASLPAAWPVLTLVTLLVMVPPVAVLCWVVLPPLPDVLVVFDEAEL